MRKSRWKRTFSVLLSVLMVAGLMPSDFGIMKVMAETPVTTSVTEANKTTWSAAAILASATTADNGLTLNDAWTENYAADDKNFDDGLSAIGLNAKANGDKAKTDGTNAAGTIPNSGCFIKYTATADGTLAIDTKIGKDKTFYIIPDQSVEEIVSKSNTTGASIFKTVEVSVKAGTTYYAYLGGATAQVWQVTFTKKVEASTWTAQDILDTSTNQTADRNLIANDAWTDNQAADDKNFDDGLSAIGLNAKANGDKAKTDGTNAAGTIPNSGCFIKYTATENGTLAIDTKIGKDKTFYIIPDQSAEEIVSKSNTTGASIFKTVEAPVKAGTTYYAYLGGATAQVWQVVFKPEGMEEPQTDWNNVAAPVINNVTVDEDGNFIVDFTAVIDKIKGAEDVKISMIQNGYEEETKTITSQTNQVIFTPGFSGNYSFVAVAQRIGCADKASEVVKKDSYTLAVKKPVIELTQNKGKGKLYLDWLNITDADVYKVEYKLSTASDYTTAVAETTDADYTLDNLTPGSNIDVRITAIRKADNNQSVYEKTGIAVTADAEQKWYTAVVGSAQQSDVTVKNGDTVVNHIELSSKDDSTDKTPVKETASAVNTDMTVDIKGFDSGKISDGEEGFTYYYTMIDPDTENFDAKATFTITDTSLTPDNQTGFGVIATDMLGVNYFGDQDYVHKYFNSVSCQMYSVKAQFIGMRNITGYSSYDTTSFDGVTRTTEEIKAKNSKPVYEVGQKYEFELKKTNDSFVAICNGEELSTKDTSILSVQEDGSICVGFMASRKVSVQLSDLSFTKSTSTGVGSGEVKDDRITPTATIYSTSTSGASEYEYIYQPNCSGDLVVTDPQGKVIYQKTVVANQVIKVNVPITVGDNEIKATLTPDASQKLTSTSPVTKTTTVHCVRYGKEGETIVVSPDGKSDGKGTSASPLDIYTAVKYAQPGQTIYMLDGTYDKGNVKIETSVSGTAAKNITMVAQTPGKVILEGSALQICGSYWHIYGIYVHKPTSTGIQISGNYNTIEMCTVEGSLNTGVQISRSNNADNIAGIESLLWPSYNLVKNCESFDNCDAGHNDADGFAAKLTCGEGNVFYGCIGHNNIDDGWDLFAKTISGEIGKVTIENCVAYNNGWLTTDDISVSGFNFGEGNGFKLGGSYMKGGHVLKNSVTFNNAGKGITSNSCPDNEIYDCTSYNNSLGKFGSFNVGLNTKASNDQAWKVSGLISMALTKNTDAEDLIPFTLASSNNYIYNGTDSYNNQGVKADNSWFESVDTSKLPTRSLDGTINMNGLLVLTDKAPVDSGARLDVTSTQAKSVQPEKTTEVTDNTTNPDQNPSDEPSGDDKPGDLPDKEESKDVVIPTDHDDIKNAVVDGDSVVKDEQGNQVSLEDVKIVISDVTADEKKEIMDKLSNNSIQISDQSDASYYQISLADLDNKVVKLEDGSVSITFQVKENIDLSKFDVIVYHVLDDGTVEKLPVTLADGTFSVVTKSFSPFVVVYNPKETVKDQDTTGDVTDSSNNTTDTTDTTGTENNNSETANDGVATADRSFAGVYFLVLCAAGLVFFETKKRKSVTK